jgi:ATP/maltotriose-dependent transcriptional regulator MalT
MRALRLDSGPGGAGKTSLVATWVAGRQGRSIWYSVAGDRDRATMFRAVQLIRELPDIAPKAALVAFAIGHYAQTGRRGEALETYQFHSR